MCDYFWQRMDSCADRGGDLADVVRSVAGASPSTSSPDTSSTWQFQIDPPAASPLPQQLSTDDFAPAGDGFGLRDPLLNELAGAAFFDCGGSGGGAGSEKSGSDGGCSSVAGVAHHHERLLTADEMKRPCSNLFSRVLQISPAKPSPLPPRAMKPLLMGAGDMVKLDHGAQISSPRTQGIKRRKGQTKKVVCIPAPAAASNKPGGEVVPSDLWAWRKYGQKPIKGSPYPRGYYRCSSSKGCSARKQVERSRTDPNMLVITYTSEHNHPWPTQRNALAGSTRSHPSKNSSSSASSASKSPSPHHNNNNNNQSRQPTPNLKEEPRESTATTTSSSLPMVKEEVVGGMENVDAITMVNDNAFDNAFYNGPVMAENQPDDFFADLAELEPDPMSLILSRPGGFIGEKPEEEEEEEEEEEDGRGKGMNQFINMFDWGGSTFGDHQSKKGL